MPASTYSPYYAPGNFVPALLGPDPSTVGSPLGHTVVQQAVPVAQQKIARSDRLEVSSFIHIHVTFYRIPIYLYINEKNKNYNKYDVIVVEAEFNSNSTTIF